MGLRPLMRGLGQRFASDFELTAMIDKLDDEGGTLDAILNSLCAAFGKKRSPSRSALHRCMTNRRRLEKDGFLPNLEQAKKAWLQGQAAAAIGYLERALDAAWDAAEPH
jgi:hypothetical protein